MSKPIKIEYSLLAIEQKGQAVAGQNTLCDVLLHCISKEIVSDG
ncbi:MAG: hypothetical protein P8J80_07215 [Porticoccaceae bacterium]|nr:hypothetical protein [Porticoccaceae bacterium]